MSKKEVRQICENTQQYFIDRMCDFCEDGREDDASALYEEIREWLVEKNRPKILSIKTMNCNFEPEA
jgi:hypothetical protein